MVAPKIAGDMNQMDVLSGQFDKANTAVQELLGSLGTITTNTIGPGWEGASAQNFLASWQNEFQPALKKLHEALGAASTEVTRRKQALVNADS
ncbi:MAG: WXG100 family type VII secretion target [Acidimicrobiia bacterium]|nr:WXG100 family type VII secretion target [Acidimicrobiia bacterium]